MILIVIMKASPADFNEDWHNTDSLISEVDTIRGFVCCLAAFVWGLYYSKQAFYVKDRCEQNDLWM